MKELYDNLYKANFLPDIPIYIYDRPCMSVHFLYIVLGGIQSESKGKNGLAHLYEHLNIRHNIQTSQFDIEGKCMVNGFTKRQYTGYIVKTDRHHIGVALELIRKLSQMTDSFSEKLIEMEKTNIRLENKQRDTINTRLADKLMRKIFTEETYGNSIICSEDSMDKIMQQDIYQYVSSIRAVSQYLFVIGEYHALKNYIGNYDHASKYTDSSIQLNLSNNKALPIDQNLWNVYAVGYPLKKLTSFKNIMILSLAANLIKWFYLSKYGCQSEIEIKQFFDHTILAIYIMKAASCNRSPIQPTYLLEKLLHEPKLPEYFNLAKKLYLYNMLKSIDTPEYISMYLFKTQIIMHENHHYHSILQDLDSIQLGHIKKKIEELIKSEPYLVGL